MTSPPGVITLSLKLVKWEEGDEHVLVTDTATELQDPLCPGFQRALALSILQMSKLRPGKVKSPGIP